MVGGTALEGLDGRDANLAGCGQDEDVMEMQFVKARMWLAAFCC